MSNYTTEVRFICESVSGLSESAGASRVDDIINAAIPKIFDFNFPIFDEEYRNVLCMKILKHYYTREIGLETYGLWKLKLNTKLNEIMPVYNKMYKATFEDFDALLVQRREHTNKHDGRTESNSEANTNSNGNAVDMYSDTPQGRLDMVEEGSYLTNASKTVNENDTTSTSDYHDHATSTDDYVEKVFGTGQSMAKTIQEYCDSLINVDLLIIDELSDLFFNLW